MTSCTSFSAAATVFFHSVCHDVSAAVTQSANRSDTAKIRVGKVFLMIYPLRMVMSDVCRSILRYLRQSTAEVGLAQRLARDKQSNSDGQKSYFIHHLDRTALKSSQDPCHTGQCVADQLRNNNGGFVANYTKTHPKDPERDLVMGYYNKNELVTYDYLAAEFSVCDHWFSSVPGSTWPNRLYAVTGRASGSKDNKTVPIYNLPAFVRSLDVQKVTWDWYSDNFFGSTLNLTDSKYRARSNYHLNDFYQQAADVSLPSVCWIDPIFVDSPGAIVANDDHPPADIRHGQDLVLNIYHALVSNPVQWNKTLFVLVYDEHGGFYDHIAPPAAEDDSPSFQSYGARVPAILVSPWVPQGQVVSKLFDHTSIIKSVLLRFCRRADGSIPDMGKRVMA